MLCRQVLEPDGIVCDEAADGLLGLTSTTWGSYDLVLLDIQMAGIDGIALAQVLEGRQLRPALVFVTAFDQFAVAAMLGTADIDHAIAELAWIKDHGFKAVTIPAKPRGRYGISPGTNV